MKTTTSRTEYAVRIATGSGAILIPVAGEHAAQRERAYWAESGWATQIVVREIHTTEWRPL